MIIRKIGVDYGSSTSVIHYTDYDNGNKQVVLDRDVLFDGSNCYVPTLILSSEGIEKSESKTAREVFGWKAKSKGGFNRKYYKCLSENFKMQLISPNTEKRKNGEELTKRFFKYLYEQYNANAEYIEGSYPEETITYVTYPAKFSGDVQNFLCKAAKEAGFPNVRLISEAEAAMQYTINTGTTGKTNVLSKFSGDKITVMLIDMGAGTTDIAVYSYDMTGEKKHKLLGCYPENGEMNFGGSEIDELLYKFYISKCEGTVCVNVGSGDEKFGEYLLKNQIRELKQTNISPELSDEDGKIDVLPDRLYPYCSGQDCDIDREVLEKILKDYLPQFSLLVNGSLENAKIKGEQIDAVMLTGGHSSWYFVKDMLLGEYDRSIDLPQIRASRGERIISFGENAQMVVARGAARYEEALVKPEPTCKMELCKVKIPGKIEKVCWGGVAYQTDSGIYGILNLFTNENMPYQWNDIVRAWNIILRYKNELSRGAFFEMKKGGEHIGVILTEKHRLILNEFIDKHHKIKCKCIENGEQLYGYFLETYTNNNQKYLVLLNLDFENFCEGLSAVMEENSEKYGYIDRSGQWIIEPQYAFGSGFQDGYAMVCQAFSNGPIHQGLIDYWGNMKYPMKKEVLGVAKEQDNFLITSGKDTETSHVISFSPFFGDFGTYDSKVYNLYGIIKRNGSILIKSEWNCVHPFCEHMAAIGVYSMGELTCGYLTEQGKLLVEGGYATADSAKELVRRNGWKEAKDFHQGAALVQNHNGWWGIVSKSGNMLTECKWGKITIYNDGTVIAFNNANMFSEKYYKSHMKFGSNEKLKFEKCNNNTCQHTVLDDTARENEANWLHWYDWSERTWSSHRKWYHSDGYVISFDGKKYGILRKDGSVVSKNQWDAVDIEVEESYTPGHMTEEGWVLFTKSVVRVKKDNLWGVINNQGSVILKPEWSKIVFEKDWIIAVKESASKESKRLYVLYDYKGNPIFTVEGYWFRTCDDNISSYYNDDGNLVILDGSHQTQYNTHFKIGTSFYNGIAICGLETLDNSQLWAVNREGEIISYTENSVRIKKGQIKNYFAVGSSSYVQLDNYLYRMMRTGGVQNDY